jgi:hypothetical protein
MGDYQPTPVAIDQNGLGVKPVHHPIVEVGEINRTSAGTLGFDRDEGVLANDPCFLDNELNRRADLGDDNRPDGVHESPAFHRARLGPLDLLCICGADNPENQAQGARDSGDPAHWEIMSCGKRKADENSAVLLDGAGQRHSAQCTART